MNTVGGQPEHDEVEDFSDPPTEAPAEQGLNVALLVPETIEVRMVEASALADYEIWFFATSCNFTLAAAFGVAYFQEDDARAAKILFVVLCIFVVLFLGFL